MRIFISHSHPDAAIAHALRQLYVSMFGDRVQIRYSSDLTAGGGISPGTSWLAWIVEEVKAADRTLVVLTPGSLNRPWLLWESGAVTGVSLGRDKVRPLVPLLYRTNSEQVPSPLRSMQTLFGDSREGIVREMVEVNRELNFLQAGALEKLLDGYVTTYLEAVNAVFSDQPLPLTEGGVQEWVLRLEALRNETRWADADTLERAMQLAFGALESKEPAPLDVRLHRLLGEIYLKAKRPEKAVRQFELALKLMPRDVYLLHKLGLAELERKRVDAALEVLKRIEKLDPQLPQQDGEIGGLAGRAYRAEWEANGDKTYLRRARDAYKTVATNVPTAYYAADVAGQLSLLLNEVDVAKECFTWAKQRIEASGERSIWSLATLATASYVLDEPDQTVKFLTELSARRPEPRDLSSIKLGLKRLVESGRASNDLFDTWSKILDGKAN